MRAIFLLLLLAAYLYAGLSPFRWSFPARETNAARWGEDGLLQFPSYGLARSRGPAPGLDQAIQTNQLELRIRVRPLPGRRPPRGTIVAIAHDSYSRNLLLNQYGRDLLIDLRIPHPAVGDRGPILVEETFPDHAPFVELGITIRPGSLRIERNGIAWREFALPVDALRGWDRNYRLTLGNYRSGNSGWFGEIAQAQVLVGGVEYNALDPAILEIPERYWRLASWPNWRPFNRVGLGENAFDLMVNFFGFVPLGLALAWSMRARRPRACLLAVLAAASVSAVIEVLQLAVPGRFTSATDFLLNVAGGTVGIYFVALWRRATGAGRG